MSCVLQAANIYLLGGGTCKRDSMWLDMVDVYNPSSQGCTPAAPLPKPCAYGAAVAIGQRLFYVGGGNGEDWFKSMLRLSLDEDTWEAVSACYCCVTLQQDACSRLPPRLHYAEDMREAMSVSHSPAHSV